MEKTLAAVNIFSKVDAPAALKKYTGGGGVEGVPQFVSIILKSLIMMSAIYAVFSFIMAGYWYISAGGEPKRIQDATAKIWQSVIGLIVAAGAFVIGGVVGQLIFGDANAVLQITLFTP